MRLSKSVVGDGEIEALTRVIKDGYLGMGTETMNFELELAEFIGIPKTSVCAVSTGTSALHLVCEYLFNPGDEVLVPSITYVASYQAISASGAVPVSVDINKSDGLICIQDARRKITDRTIGLMYVHYGGNTGDIIAIEGFCKEFHLALIHDAAHSFGSKYQTQRVGFRKGIYCFSFDGIKNITCGEGGAIISNNKELIEFCNDTRLLGVKKDTEQRYEGKRSFIFDVTNQGYRYHLSNLNASIGRVQLKRFSNEFEIKRRELYVRYVDQLKKQTMIQILECHEDCLIVPHIMPILCETIEYKMQLQKKAEQFGIQTGVHYYPNHKLSRFLSNTSLPDAEDFFERQMTLPLHPDLEQNDVDYIINKLFK